MRAQSAGTANWTATVAASIAVVTTPAEPTGAPPWTAHTGTEASVRKKLAVPRSWTTRSRRMGPRPGGCAAPATELDALEVTRDGRRVSGRLVRPGGDPRAHPA